MGCPGAVRAQHCSRILAQGTSPVLRRRRRPPATDRRPPSLPPHLCALAGLSTLTWVLPERFEEGELTIEALHTALGLLASFHDSIISVAPGAPAPPGADLALALSTLEQVQVCVPYCSVLV